MERLPHMPSRIRMICDIASIGELWSEYTVVSMSSVEEAGKNSFFKVVWTDDDGDKYFDHVECDEFEDIFEKPVIT